MEPRTDTQTPWAMVPPAMDMAKRRVLVLYSGSLIAQGVGAMLRKLASIDTAAIDVEEPDALERARATQPDVVVVDMSELRGPCQELFLGFLEEFPTLRVVCLRPEGDTVDIFCKQRVHIRQAQDLIATLLEP
jgi:chemotaxis response regulator CheB